MKAISNTDYEDLSKKYLIPVSLIRTIVAVESAGHGFDPITKKIIIQFEPSWFKRLWVKWKNNIGLWSQNKVENQIKEWLAFNDAFMKNPTAAMESTSIGLMQVMGFHYKKLGFISVGYMWDFAKESEKNQLELGLKFIKNNPNLYNNLINKNWAKFAYYYNGSNYRINNYDKKLELAYNKNKKYN